MLKKPMRIDGYLTRPATVRIAAEGVLEITIHEGRNRQVRKMCAQAGLEVKKLTRIAEGSLKLGNLPVGTWRYLSNGEIRALLDLIGSA